MDEELIDLLGEDVMAILSEDSDENLDVQPEAVSSEEVEIEEVMDDEALEEEPDDEDDGAVIMAKRKKMPRWRKIALITVSTLLILLLLLGIAAVWYVNYLLDQVGQYDPSNDTLLDQGQVDDILDKDPDLEVIHPDEDLPNIEDFEPTPDIQPIEKQDNVVNILVVGQDTRQAGIRARSDTMILITIHKDSKKVTLTSFMRDAYVKIPGYASHKMNHSFQYGGLKLLNETMLVNYGVKVDGNVIIDFSAFQSVIDMLGGVDIRLTEKEAVYLRNGCKHDVQPGMNRLYGAAALDYARLHEIDSDYQRTSRQRTVIQSLIERYKNLPVTEMLAMLDDILPLIVTDLSKNKIVDFVMTYGPVAASATVHNQQIPQDGTFNQGFVQVRPGLKNWFQYNIDFVQNRKILEDIMHGRN